MQIPFKLVQLLFLLLLEHRSEHTTSHSNRQYNYNSIFNFVGNFGFTNKKIGKIGGFSLQIGENRNMLKK